MRSRLTAALLGLLAGVFTAGCGCSGSGHHGVGRFWLAFNQYWPGTGAETKLPLLGFTDRDGIFNWSFVQEWQNRTSLGWDLLVDGNKIRGIEVRDDAEIPVLNDATVRLWQNIDGTYPWASPNLDGAGSPSRPGLKSPDFSRQDKYGRGAPIRRDEDGGRERRDGA